MLPWISGENWGKLLSPPRGLLDGQLLWPPRAGGSTTRHASTGRAAAQATTGRDGPRTEGEKGRRGRGFLSYTPSWSIDYPR